MKICYIGDPISIHLQHWVKWFADRGHEVHVVTYHPYEFDNPYIHVHEVKMSWLDLNYLPHKSMFAQLRKFGLIIKEINPDIVHGHYIAAYGLHTAFAGNYPKVLSAWGSDIADAPECSVITKYAIKFALKKADLIHVQDPLSKKRILELYKKAESKVAVVPWGVDTNKFSPIRKLKKIKKKLQVKDGPVVVVVRDLEPRFIKTTLKTIDLVVSEIPNVNFLIIKTKNYKNQVKKYRIEENIQFLGRIKHKYLPEVFANSDIFIDPYYPKKPNEIGHTYGIGLVEAMACGTPTISANRPTIFKLKGKDKWYFGHTFEGGNSRDMAEKIIKLLNDKEEMKKIARKGREIVEKKFDWDKNMEKIEKEIYPKLK